MIKFNVLSRFSGEVAFTAEIDCRADASNSVKLGLAVRWAIKSRANLSGADLSGAYLGGANLSRADLSRADLSGANLSRADLSGADLSGAYLSRADLSRANLSGADLSRAYLGGANLGGAYLSRADLSGADLSRANLSRADLSGAYLSRQWIIQGGTRADGYAFFLMNLTCEGVRVKAGCRNFSIAEAEAHWSSTRGDTPLGRETALLIACMIKQAKARGLSFDVVKAEQ